MTRVVQAECPHCKKPLRIPADWIAQQMKCKHCQHIFQARVPPGKSHDTPLPASPFAQLDEPIAETRRARMRRRRGPWKPWLVLGVLAAMIGAVLIIAWPRLGRSLETNNISSDATGADKQRAVQPERTPLKPSPKFVPKAGEPFPRRALLINVSNYLLFNPLHYGNPRDSFPGKYPGSSTAVLADTLSRPPLNIPATQITELADGGRSPFATSKPVIESTLTEFTATSRPQDRIIVLFTGHALAKDKEAYLVPVEGDRDDIKTLIPLAWIYDTAGAMPGQAKGADSRCIPLSAGARRGIAGHG